MKKRILLATLSFLIIFTPAYASGLDGAEFSWFWGIPFAGMLLSIALFPLINEHFWEHHQGKVAFFWALAIILPLYFFVGGQSTTRSLIHTFLLEYMPFILLLSALFTVSGGIVVRGNIHGTPLVNTSILALGTFLASVIGTTGAAMVLIRPIIRANDNRIHNVHLIIFFIFLVANIGGSLSPLGDPPLFLGFLRGVGFFWTLQHIIFETLFVSISLLIIFFIIDSYYYKKEGTIKPDPTPDRPVKIVGGINFMLILAIILAILMSASLRLGDIEIFHVKISIANLTRDCALILIIVLSLTVTPQAYREENEFNWAPILEVAKLFAGIFVTIIPVLAILQAGENGAFAALTRMVTEADGVANNKAYFWITGILSSVLDNAPTYLVFFELAGGEPYYLMTTGAKTLAAISCGAVFMGAMTYIGNAPNFMVYAIARRNGIKMPSFFAYILWTVIFLLPLFLLMSFIFF